MEKRRLVKLKKTRPTKYLSSFYEFSLGLESSNALQWAQAVFQKIESFGDVVEKDCHGGPSKNIRELIHLKPWRAP